MGGFGGGDGEGAADDGEAGGCAHDGGDGVAGDADAGVEVFPWQPAVPVFPPRWRNKSIGECEFS